MQSTEYFTTSVLARRPYLKTSLWDGVAGVNG